MRSWTRQPWWMVDGRVLVVCLASSCHCQRPVNLESRLLRTPLRSVEARLGTPTTAVWLSTPPSSFSPPFADTLMPAEVSTHSAVPLREKNRLTIHPSRPSLSSPTISAEKTNARERQTKRNENNEEKTTISIRLLVRCCYVIIA